MRRGTRRCVPLGHAVEGLRTVKDEDELALLREACAISDRALAETLGSVAPGLTEREVGAGARGRDGRARRRRPGVRHDRRERAEQRGAAPPADRAGDRRAATCSRSTSARVYGGYHADCTRTLVVGPRAGGLAARDLRRRARRPAGRPAGAGRRRRRPRGRRGRPATWSRTPATARPSRTASGHGVGLEIHEAPLLGYAATGRLAARTPVTVEPGVYLPGRGGVRIEDTLVVRRRRARAAHHHPQGPAGPLTDLREGLTPWRRRTTSRTAWCSTSTASCGPSSSSSTSSPARAARSCAPSSRTCSPARSSTRPSTPAPRSRPPPSTSATCSTSTRRATDFVFMDTETYDQIHVPAETVGDGAELHAGEPGRRRRDARGHAALRRAAGLGRAGDLLHRARPAGRPLHRRHQAGDAGDRRRDRGAAVHHHRREGQGRHPRRRLPRPRDGLPDGRPQQGPQAGARRPVRGRPARSRPGAGDARRPARRGRPAGLASTPSSWSRAWSPTRRASTSCWRRTPAAGRWTGCRRWTARILRLGDLRAAVARRRARRRGRSTRRSTLARSLSTDESPAFVNGLLGPDLPELKPTLAAEPAATEPAAESAAGRAADRAAGRPSPAGAAVRGPASARVVALSAVSRAARRASALSTPQVISCSVSCDGRLVVDDGQRAQVVLADRQHPAVVVAALAWMVAA